MSALTGEERRLRAQAWLGPMPTPEVLRQYDEIVPGAAERILRMAERVPEDHARLIDAEIGHATQGRRMAFVLALIAIGSAIGFFAVGNEVAGGLLLSMPVVTFVQTMMGKFRD